MHDKFGRCSVAALVGGSPHATQVIIAWTRPIELRLPEFDGYIPAIVGRLGRLVEHFTAAHAVLSGHLRENRWHVISKTDDLLAGGRATWACRSPRALDLARIAGDFTVR